MTQNGAAKQDDINTDARIPSSVTFALLEKLQNENLVDLENGLVEVDDSAKVKLAVKAVELGAGVERISDFLSWREFEEIASVALDLNGYVAARNVHFTQGGRRWEIDVVGCKKPLVVCIDCKQWHHGMNPSTLARIAESQARRVDAFSKALPNVKLALPCVKWEKAQFIPVIVSLISGGSKFFGRVPVVPVLQLQDFISQLPLQMDSLKYFTREFSHL